MSLIIDKRLNGRDKNLGNRQRLLRKLSEKIKGKFKKKEIGENIDNNVSTDSLDENPIYADYKSLDSIHINNDRFESGDRIPVSGGDGESKGPSLGEGDILLSTQEYLNIVLDNFRLPRIEPSGGPESKARYRNGGITTSGPMSRLHLIRTMQASLGRRLALGRPMLEDPDTEENERKRQAIPFLDDIDLRFRSRIKYFEPSYSAVMFCLMDVSGSMDEAKVSTSKYFFWILWYMLKQKYNKVSLVFIRHTDRAEVVTQEQFFGENKNGGTAASSALAEALKVYKSGDYSGSNIYIAETSDGENYGADNDLYLKYLSEILQFTRFFAYLQINSFSFSSIGAGDTMYDFLKDYETENFAAYEIEPEMGKVLDAITHFFGGS